MEILGGRERMGNGREQSEQEPSQAHGEPLLGKRVKRHVLLAQSAIEEMIELLGSLNDGRRMREEQALPDETTAAVPGLAHTMRKSWKTTVGLVMRGVTIDAIIPGGPADAAGSLRRFDQVLKVDGRDVNERTVMSEVMSTDTADTTVQLVVRRASSESRSPHNELGVQEVQVVLTRVPYASLGASLRTYETLERLRRNADFMSKFEKFQELPGEEPSWVLVEMLKLEFDAQHQRRHDLYKSQEKKLQDSANVIMRHMLLTKEVLAQLAQEHQDMLQFTQHAWLALQDRDKEEAQMEELLEKLVDQVNNNKMELEELHGINRASCMSCPELKVQIQRQEAELLKHFKSAFELKAAFDRAAHELNREADMQRERVAELEGKLRRVQAEADSCKQKLSANQGQLLDREQGSKQREGTQSAAESSVGTMMLLLADAVALGELLHHDLAHDAGSDAVNENTVLRDRVAALEAELSASQRFLHDVELLLQEETSAKKLLTDLQHEKNILEAHVEKRDHDIAELERQLHECRETLHLRDQSLIERQAQLETLTKRVEEAFETVEKLTGLEHVKNSLEAHVEKQDHDMAELERQLHDCRETLHLREAQLEALSDRVKEAFETVEKQGQAKESATQLNQELQLALDIKCGELDIKCGELDVAYYAYNRAILRYQSGQSNMEQAAKIVHLLIEDVANLREDSLHIEEFLQSHEMGTAKASRKPQVSCARGNTLSPVEDESTHDKGLLETISSLKTQVSRVTKMEEEIEKFLDSYFNDAQQKRLQWPLERQVEVLHRVLGVVCSTGLGADTQARLESILEQIRMQSMADSEMMSNLQNSTARLLDSLESQEHTLASTQSFLRDHSQTTLLYVSLDRAHALPLVENQEGCIYVHVEGQSGSMMTKIIVGPEPQIKETFVLPLDHPRQEVVFALYARESDGHSLVASLLVPLDQLFSGLPFRAWVQLVDSNARTLVSIDSGEAAAIRLEARLRGSSTFMDAVKNLPPQRLLQGCPVRLDVHTLRLSVNVAENNDVDARAFRPIV